MGQVQQAILPARDAGTILPVLPKENEGLDHLQFLGVDRQLTAIGKLRYSAPNYYLQTGNGI